MTGFREKEKGLLRKKGKVAQSVDNSTDCVDNLLTKRRAFADNAFALPCKDCAFTMVKRFGIEKISAVCANFNATLRLLSASGGSARVKSKPRPYLPKQQALCWADSEMFVKFKPAVPVNRNSTAQFVAILANSAAIGCGLLRLIGCLRLISFVKQGCGLLRAFLSNYLLVF